jgi:hypothetical protein
LTRARRNGGSATRRGAAPLEGKKPLTRELGACSANVARVEREHLAELDERTHGLAGVATRAKRELHAHAEHFPAERRARAGQRS